MARRRTVLTLSFFLCAGSALAAQTAPVATLTAVSGNVMVDSGKGFVAVQDGAALTAGARVLVGRNSAAKIAYSGAKDCVQILGNRGVTKVQPACPSMASAMTRSIVSGSVTPAAMALPVVYGVSTDAASGTATSGTTLATGSLTSGGTTGGTVDSSTGGVSTGGTGTSVPVVTGSTGGTSTGTNTGSGDLGGSGSGGTVDVSTGTGSGAGGVVDGGVLGTDNSGTVSSGGSTAGSGSGQVVGDSGVVTNTPGAVLGTIAFGDVSTDPAREGSPSPTL